MRKMWRLGVSALFVGLMAAPFQNCSKQKLSSAQNAGTVGAAAQVAGGNGTGYDGKPYVRGLCADRSPSKIVLVDDSDTQGLVVRENCTDLAPARPVAVNGGYKLASVDVIIADGAILSPEAKPQDYLAVCRGVEDGEADILLTLWYKPDGRLSGELVRKTRDAAGTVNSTGPRDLNSRSALGVTEFRSLEQNMGNDILQGQVSRVYSTGNVSYNIPGVNSFEVESVSCAVSGP